MKTIEKDDWKFSVDVEKTKEYYKNISLCDCPDCRNYNVQIEEKLPKLKDFLEEFGVDVSRPDEICSCTYEEEIDYYAVYYTVCGEIIEDSKYEIDIYDNLFLSIVVHDGESVPNEQTESYFTFSVMQIQLPWVLDEPFPDTRRIPEKMKATTKKLVIDKFHGIFKKITRS